MKRHLVENDQKYEWKKFKCRDTFPHLLAASDENAETENIAPIDVDDAEFYEMKRENSTRSPCEPCQAYHIDMLKSESNFISFSVCFFIT